MSFAELSDNICLCLEADGNRNSPGLDFPVASDFQWFGLQLRVHSLSMMAGPSLEDHHSRHRRCPH